MFATVVAQGCIATYSLHLYIDISCLMHLRLEMLDVHRICLLWQVYETSECISSILLYTTCSILYNLVIFFSMEDRNETTCMQGSRQYLATDDITRHVYINKHGHHHCISIAAVLEHISKLPEYLINLVIFF